MGRYRYVGSTAQLLEARTITVKTGDVIGGDSNPDPANFVEVDPLTLVTVSEQSWGIPAEAARVQEDFSGEADGPLDSLWHLVSSVSGVKQAAGDASGLSVVSGAVSNTTTVASPAAGYATADARARITRLAADIAFSSSSTAGGAAALVPFADNVAEQFPTIPDSDSHVTVAPGGWTWGIFRDNVFTSIANGSWEPLFAWGTDTFRRVEIVLGDGVGYLTGPDGITYTVTDSRIGQTDVQWATFETYQGTAASTDARASFQRVAFDTAVIGPAQPSPTPLEVARRLAGVQSLIVPQAAALSYGPSSAATYFMPGSSAVVDATNLSLPFVVPASGNIAVELDGWIQWLATPANFFWEIHIPEIGSTFNTTQMAADANATSKRYHVIIPILGIGASFVATTIHLQWSHWSLTAGSGELLAQGPPGQPAVMKVTALA